MVIGLGVGWVRAKVGSPLHEEELELEQRSRGLRAVALCRHAQPPRGSIIVDAHVLDPARAGEARQLGPLRLGEHGLGQARVPPGVPWHVVRTVAVPMPAALRPKSVQLRRRQAGTCSTYSTEKRRTYVSTQGAAARAALHSRAQPRCGKRGCEEARPGPRDTCNARRRRFGCMTARRSRRALGQACLRLAMTA